jgi:hypothetical protein
MLTQNGRGTSTYHMVIYYLQACILQALMSIGVPQAAMIYAKVRGVKGVDKEL